MSFVQLEPGIADNFLGCTLQLESFRCTLPITPVVEMELDHFYSLHVRYLVFFAVFGKYVQFNISPHIKFRLVKRTKENKSLVLSTVNSETGNVSFNYVRYFKVTSTVVFYVMQTAVLLYSCAFLAYFSNSSSAALKTSST